jgi:hypothetical protein
VNADLLNAWAAALIAYLKLEFPEAEVIDGERSGVSRDKDRLCVFWPGSQEDGNVNYSHESMVIRFWPARSKQPTDNPDDPTPLRKAGMDLRIALQAVQTPGSLVADLYCRLVSVQPDYDPQEWGIEAVLYSWTLNPATLPQTT